MPQPQLGVDPALPAPRRLPWLASLSPTGARVVAAWFISLVLHMAALAVMFAVVFPFSARETPDVPPDVRTRVVGRIDAPSLVPNKVPTPTSDTVPIQPARTRFSPVQADAVSEMLSPPKPELPVIGIGTGGGDFAGLGLSLGRGSGPEFFGLGSSARGAKRIVYVVDRSGSMLDTFGYVRAELKRSVSALRRSQKFHVVFFNEGAPIENPPKRLVPARGAYKDELFRFLGGIRPSGGTDPAPALARAFNLEPDLIYLLSDGDRFDPNLLHQLDEWNRRRKVQVFTIAYLDQGGRAILERIAREHGGEFKFVSEYDLP